MNKKAEILWTCAHRGIWLSIFNGNDKGEALCNYFQNKPLILRILLHINLRITSQ